VALGKDNNYSAAREQFERLATAQPADNSEDRHSPYLSIQRMTLLFGKAFGALADLLQHRFKLL
jgi:hypothetical protein